MSISSRDIRPIAPSVNVKSIRSANWSVSRVSIGSPYQYFPGKEALVAAVIERHPQQIMQTVRNELTQASTQPLDRAIRKFVAVAVAAHRLDPQLHRVLAEQIPRVGKLEKLETFSRENFSLLRAYLEGVRDERSAAPCTSAPTTPART